jgi:uncharacterized protein
MMSPAPGLTEADLETLDAFLMSDQVPDDCMQLSDLDGFLTAVAIGPELIMPSEWLPAIWGDGEPEFEAVEEAQRIINVIMVRYNEILHRLHGHPDGIEPLFWETPAGDVVAGDWAEGFMDGVALRKDSWHPLFHSDEGAALLAPILAFVQDPDDDAVPEGTADERAELHAAAVDLIPSTVEAIDAFWKARQRPPRRAVKTGRNDPCPCGSTKRPPPPRPRSRPRPRSGQKLLERPCRRRRASRKAHTLPLNATAAHRT